MNSKLATVCDVFVCSVFFFNECDVHTNCVFVLLQVGCCRIASVKVTSAAMSTLLTQHMMAAFRASTCQAVSVSSWMA